MTRIKTIPAQKIKKKTHHGPCGWSVGLVVARSVFPPCFRPFQMRLLRRAVFLYQYEIRGRSFFAASGSHGHKAQASTRRRSRHPSPGWMIMKTALQCLALMALAESAAAFAPSSSFLPRHPLLSAATCSIRAQPPAKQGGARAAPLRLGGLRLAVSSAPVTISGTNIEVLCPSLVCLHRPQGASRSSNPET